jgi:heterodisulfide reductase subunit A-like polyferredoxin
MTDPVLIIGAGVAGLTAAVELADSGRKTVVVERLRSAGGNALVLYKAFPTDDCFYCFEGSRNRPGIRKCFYRSALLDNPNIDLRLGSHIEKISGSPGKFNVRIESTPAYVDPKKCIMCGLCIKYSESFMLLSPQCQPQAVLYDPEKRDEGAQKAQDECPTKAINLEAQSTSEELTASNIIVATGYDEMKPSIIEEYGYGKHPNVITQLELAEILDPNGRTGGLLLRPSDNSPAKRIVMVQCVGSRDENYYPYCSKICCVFALKHANIISSERSGAQVSVVYMDIRTYDSHERYYRNARKSGVEFIRGRVTRVEPESDGSLDVIVYDSLLDKYLKFGVDLLVLSSALEPPQGSDGLIAKLGVGTASGFLASSEVSSGTEVVVGDHIYACGSALGPCEVPESVTQARAVVSKILQERV